MRQAPETDGLAIKRKLESHKKVMLAAPIAAVFGITTLTLAFRSRFVKHRKWGRITSVIWFFTAITGIAVYVLRYMMYPGGHTAPMINAILG
jgi:putative membrane protein